MNLNQLWAGNDYAWYEWRSRGETYRSNGKRVRIIRAFQERIPGNDRLSGFAEVQMLDDEGNIRLDWESNPIVKKVRARDIAMRWDEYEDERNHREAEKERIQREAEEKEAAEIAEKARFIDAVIEKYKFPREAIQTVGTTYITISRRMLERDLNGTNEID